MAETFINILFTGIGLYLFCGWVFSIIFIFITKGVQVVDEDSNGSGIGFKLIIIPGCMVFWPLLLKKWRKLKK